MLFISFTVCVVKNIVFTRDVYPHLVTLTMMLFYVQGVIAGGILGFAATMFVNLGSLTVSGYHQTLPPTRTDACEAPINATETTSPVSL